MESQGNQKRQKMVLADDLAVVTGGSSGIGQATTLRLLSRGWAVVVMSPIEQELVRTRDLLDETHSCGTMISVCADIQEVTGLEAVVDAVKKSGKTLRLIIHNAGVNTPCKRMMDLSRKEWSRVMDINMNGPLFLTQALYPHFGRHEAEKNRVLFLTTVAKMCTGLPNYGPYCVSKLGASGIAKMLQEELSTADPKVHVSMLIPGEVNTGMQEATAYSNSSGFPEHLVAHWRRLHEMKLLLPPVVAGAFIEYVVCDTSAQEFSSREWFLYDKDHQIHWASEFPDVNLEEPKGLAGKH